MAAVVAAVAGVLVEAAPGLAGGGATSSPDNTLVFYLAPTDISAAKPLWDVLSGCFRGDPEYGTENLADSHRIEIPAIFTFESTSSPTTVTSATTSPPSGTEPGQGIADTDGSLTITTTIRSRNVPVRRVMPVLHSRSALGILHALVDDPLRMAIVIKKSDFETLEKCISPDESYYNLDFLTKKKLDLLHRRDFTAAEYAAFCSCNGLKDPREKTFLIIVESEELPPANAFVTVQYKADHRASNARSMSDKDTGLVWYYIDGRDEVSKKTFALITQFLSMQALPNQSPSLTPTIPVGGSH